MTYWPCDGGACSAGGAHSKPVRCGARGKLARLPYNQADGNAGSPEFLDRCITEFDAALRTVTGTATASRASPASDAADSSLSASERDLAARLMRVNHAGGEIAAQALYRGQALVARDEALRSDLLRAAREEHDHLAWCASADPRTRRATSAASHRSGSWARSPSAPQPARRRPGQPGLSRRDRAAGHRASRRPPACGCRARTSAAGASSSEMRAEEMRHRHDAVERGAAELPPPVRFGMRAGGQGDDDRGALSLDEDPSLCQSVTGRARWQASPGRPRPGGGQPAHPCERTSQF